MQRPETATAKGFTLLEVLVALVILAIGLLGLNMYQGHLVKSNALAKQRSEATMLAEQKIDQFRSYTLMSGYTAIAAGSDSITGTNAQYDRSWTVATCANPVSASTRCKAVVVNVGWTAIGGASNAPESISLNTDIVANNPARTGDLVMTAPPAPPPPNPIYSCTCKITGGVWNLTANQDPRCSTRADACTGSVCVEPPGNTRTCTFVDPNS